MCRNEALAHFQLLAVLRDAVLESHLSELPQRVPPCHVVSRAVASRARRLVFDNQHRLGIRSRTVSRTSAPVGRHRSIEHACVGVVLFGTLNDSVHIVHSVILYPLAAIIADRR